MSLCTFLAGCTPNDDVIETNDPYLSSHLRYMRMEVATIAVTNAPKDAQITIDFGDGTEQTTKGSTPVSHQYSKSGDYKITASWDNEELTNTIRVYDLLALTEAMKQFKNPNYEEVWVMCHRAHTTNRSVPENSCAAVRDAVAAGADILELDTHITADGVVMVCHNETIDATTNGSGRIPDLTLAQIKSYFLKDRNGNVTTEKMPTLEEYLKEARGKVYINMDYSPRTASSAQVYAVVQKLDMLEQVFFYCNSVEKINECIALNPKCQVYPWFSNYSALKELPGIYFVQASFNSSGVEASVASGAILSVNMKSVTGTDGASAYKFDTSEADLLFSKFPDCRMIQTDTPVELINYLKSKGKK